jgi:hypothetical protein
MLLRKWVLREAAGEGGDQGGAPAGGAPAGGGSLLGDALKGAAPAAGAPAGGGEPTITPSIDPATGRPSHIPERFWDAETKAVKTDDVLKSYGELEKRMKDVGLPPADPSGYEWKPPEGLDIDQTRAKAFADEAHAAGLSKKQYEFVMGKYADMMTKDLPQMVSDFVEGQRGGVEQQLRQAWGQEYDANMKHAVAAFNAFTDDAERAEIDRIGNNPVLLRILARVGRELGEDKSVENAILPTDDIEALMRDKAGAYWNAQHPQHAAVKARVTRHYEAVAKAQARKG